MKLYVIAPSGMDIAGYGSRAYGEHFDLPEDVISELSQRPEFSLDNPSQKTALSLPRPVREVPAEEIKT